MGRRKAWLRVSRIVFFSPISQRTMIFPSSLNSVLSYNHMWTSWPACRCLKMTFWERCPIRSIAVVHPSREKQVDQRSSREPRGEEERLTYDGLDHHSLLSTWHAVRSVGWLEVGEWWDAREVEGEEKLILACARNFWPDGRRMSCCHNIDGHNFDARSPLGRLSLRSTLQRCVNSVQRTDPIFWPTLKHISLFFFCGFCPAIPFGWLSFRAWTINSCGNYKCMNVNILFRRSKKYI
jgi:hypothetical protein